MTQQDHPHNPPADEQLDAELDALLAEEALDAPAVPDQLETKVLALTDPQLMSLLDDALAPESVPEHLADNILAATMPSAQQPAVLAQIGPSTWRYAAAAALLLAAGVGLWWSGQNPDANNTSGIADNGNRDVALPDDFIEEAEAEVLFASATEQVEEVLIGVSERLDTYSTSNDDIWSDMDGYEQFLSELESS